MNTDSSIFLLVGATFFLTIFSLPLLITPMRWARILRWKIPDDTDLANYLGRSLGALAVPLNIMMYVTARDPWAYRAIFDFLILTGVFLCAVHVYGFIKKVQPLSEHLEIIMYAGVVLLTWYFYPQPPV
jgi:succinate-acetate transporter protein